MLGPLNQMQSSILKKNKQQVKAFFSKLPCIKTCMSRVEVVHESDNPPGCSSSKACASKPKESRRIGFEQVDDDFAT